MASYNQTLTESIKLGESLLQTGPTDLRLVINGNDYSDCWDSIKVLNSLNEISSADIGFFSLNYSQWADVSEGKIVKIYWGKTLIFKGIIQEFTPNSDETINIKALDSGCIALMNRGFQLASPAGRYRKTATATNTIVSEVCSVNLNGSSPWVITVNTNTNYGNVNFRAENINRLQALRNLAKLCNYDWWTDRDSSENDRFNHHTRKGSASPVKSFYTYGNNENCFAERKKDKSQLWNAIVVKGYGDGTSQITSSEYTDSGSITTWGRHEKVWTDKAQKDSASANILASNILADHKDPVDIFTLTVDDITEILPSSVVVGDEITVYDTTLTSGSTNYKIVSIELNFTQSDYYAVLTCHDKSYTWLEDALQMKDEMETEGSTGTILDPGHDHDSGSLTGTSHGHDDGTYGAVSHGHDDGTYATDSHTHPDGTYATDSHTHPDGTYTTVTHAHPVGTYAGSGHQHTDGTYATVTHGHPDGSLYTDNHGHDDGSYYTDNHSHGDGGYGTDTKGSSDTGYYYGTYSDSLSSGSWQTCSTGINTGGPYYYFFHAIWGFFRVEFDAGAGYSWSQGWYVRAYNSTSSSYYPSSSGLQITAGFTASGDFTVIAPFYIYIPYDWSNQTYYLQYYITNSSYWSGTQEIRYAYHACRGHTHDVSGSSGNTQPGVAGSSGNTQPGVSGSTGDTAPDVSGSSGSQGVSITGDSGNTAPDVSGSSGSTAPDVSGSSGSTAPGVGGASGNTAPDVSGSSGSTAGGVSGTVASDTTGVTG